MAGRPDRRMAGPGRSALDSLLVIAAAACMVLGPAALFGGLSIVAPGTEPAGYVPRGWPIPLVLAGAVLPVAGFLIARRIARTPVTGLLFFLLVGSLVYFLLASLIEWREATPLEQWPALRDTIEEEVDTWSWPPLPWD